MRISKEMLMAYVDGELDASARAHVETAMAADPQLAGEVERQRALQRQLQSAFGEVLHEPVPQRLLAAARTAPAAVVETKTPETKITDLGQARQARAEKSPRRWRLPEWGAMAACLAVGLLLGQQLWHAPQDSPFVTEDGRIVARGTLAQALSAQLSGSSAGAQVQVALSFKDSAGGYCRAFVMHDGSGLAGMACREQGDWRVQVLARTSEGSGSAGYRMADSALPASVLQSVQDRIAGDPLDAAAEGAARDRQWK